MAQVAVCSQINTKHINAVWAEHKIVECQTVGASRNQWALKGSTRACRMGRHGNKYGQSYRASKENRNSGRPSI